MWPFKKPPTPPPARRIFYSTTDLQAGDECVCIDDEAHRQTHQKLLSEGVVYTVRRVSVSTSNDHNYGGPHVRLAGVMPDADAGWDCQRFRKVIKDEKRSAILTQVMEPCGLDVEKEKELAPSLSGKGVGIP